MQASPLILPSHLLRYGTFCSGIEAVTVAWEGLGWHPAFFSEIDRFPCSVLEVRYPNIPNLGDMTKVDGEALQGLLDVLVAGTPCQSFSVAGLRMGLSDERGNLTLELVKIYDASGTAYLLWENVPGVLSDAGNAFGCFIAALAGSDLEAEPGPRPPLGKSGKFWRWDRERQYHVPRWPVTGWVAGPRRTIAWRTLDAQYFGLAQRRRRVFLVAGPRDGADPRKVLFEFHGMRRDFAPRRQKTQDIAGTLEASIGRSRGAGTSPAAITVDRNYVPDIVGQAMSCKWSKGTSGPAGDEHHNLVAYALRAEGYDASEDGTGRQNLVIMPINTQVGLRHNALGERTGLGIGEDGAPAFTLQGAHGHAVAILPSGEDEPVPALTQNFYADDGTRDGLLVPVAFAQNTRDEVRLQGGDGSLVGCLGANEGMKQRTYVAIPGAAPRSSVRRLTPLECERLQGFPDGYTALTDYPAWRDLDEHESPEELAEAGYQVRRTKKGVWRVNDPDGPRYKALGNSMAVDVMRWLGGRLKDAILEVRS
jgi:DNA (cytosine-5)-methyltransferase 1